MYVINCVLYASDKPTPSKLWFTVLEAEDMLSYLNARFPDNKDTLSMQYEYEDDSDLENKNNELEADLEGPSAFSENVAAVVVPEDKSAFSIS